MMRECKRQTLNIKYPTPKVGLTETWVVDVGYSVLDILKKNPKKPFQHFDLHHALMIRECKHQTLNIKYPTPKVGLTETWVFDVGYSVLDILKKNPRKPFQHC